MSHKIEKRLVQIILESDASDQDKIQQLSQLIQRDAVNPPPFQNLNRFEKCMNQWERLKLKMAGYPEEKIPYLKTGDRKNT